METVKTSIRSFLREKLKEYDLFDGHYELTKLIELSKVKVPETCHGNWNYSMKRGNFGAHRFMKRQKGKTCFVCDVKCNLHRHHIIPLANGGVSIKENIVGLCEQCHSIVHGFVVGTGYRLN